MEYSKMLDFLSSDDITVDDGKGGSTYGFTKEDMTLRPDELSGGMKMRVSLARAFLKDAPILLLDEPTKELDPRNADIVRQIILELSRNRLVILVSHDRDDAIFSDSAVILL